MNAGATSQLPPTSDLRKAICSGFAKYVPVGCGLFAVLLGLVVLVGWWLQAPMIKSIVPGVVSMKANTALCLVLAGLSLALLAEMPVTVRRARAGRLLAVAVVVIGGLTWSEYVLDWQLGIDELLFRDDPNAVGTLIPGRMAPSSAGCFILLGLALFGIQWQPRAGFRPAEGLALVVVVVSLSSLVEYVVGEPILYGFSQYTRMAWHTAVVFLVLSAGVVTARPAQGMLGALRAGLISPWEGLLHAVMGLALLGVLTGGAWFYHGQEDRVQRTAQAELRTIARFKAEQLVNWRNQRLNDASVIMESMYLNEGIANWLENPNPIDEGKILTRFRSTANHYHYSDILLVDTHGQIRLSLTGRHGQLHPQDAEALADGLRGQRAMLTDLHLNPGDGTARMSAIAPLVESTSGTVKPRGAVILQIDASEYLDPLIRSWPVPSNTAETLFFRRDGDSVLFLSKSRQLHGPVLQQRIPLSRIEVPAVMAALGRHGVIQSTNDRAVEVMSVLQAIPDSPWFLITQQDMAEIFAPLHQLAWTTGIIVALLILMLTLALGFVWHQQTGAEVLREREENMAVTLQAIGDGVLATDANGCVTRLNPVAEQLTGWSETQAKGHPAGEVFRILNETTRDPEVVPVNTVLQVGKRYGLTGHSVLLARDGGESPISVSAAPIHDRDGDLLGVVMVFHDITAQRRAEQEIHRLNASLEQRVIKRTAQLRESEERFRLMVESVRDYAIIMLDVDGRVVNWNAGAQRIHGYQADEIIGQSIARFYPAADVAHGKPARELALAASVGRSEDEDWRVHKDGFRFIANIVITAIRDVAGQLRGFAQVTRNITERKQAQESLALYANRTQSLLQLNQMSEATLQEITDYALEEAVRLTQSSMGYLAFLNEDETILTLHSWSNTAMEDCAIPSKPIIYPVDSIGLWSEAIRQRGAVITNDDPSSNDSDGHATIQRHLNMPVIDGSRIVLIAGVGNKPGDYDQGDVQQLTLLMESMWRLLERKRAQEAIRQLNADLEQRVRERTTQLEMANKELEAFSYAVSHDLRAPLRHVLGYGEMLTRESDGQLTDKGRHYLKTITDASAEMSVLIDDLLAFCRMSRAEMGETNVNLNHLIGETLRGLETASRGRNIEWRIPPLPAVRSDPAMLKQVISNLLDNAIKYTRPRDPAIIEIGSAGMEDDRLILFVRDNGVGFNPEYAHKLFGVFQRLHRTEDFEGAGIGLANVRRIITRHGGRTWAEGKPNEGATFYFTIKPITP